MKPEVTVENGSIRVHVGKGDLEKTVHRIRGIDDLIGTIRLLFMCEKNAAHPDPMKIGYMEKTLALYE